MRAAVWAPGRARVRVVVEGVERDLNRDPDRAGWWIDDRELAVGTRYAFLLDDDATPAPDPRGRRQPAGVDGPSEVVDPGLRADTSGWAGRELAGRVIYELHVGTFTTGSDGGPGTLDTAIARLDHLVDLGIDFVELLPVNTFSGAYNWGYDGVGWFAVDESYGGVEAYVRFVDAAHARGLGVIQDVVYNHLGPRGNHLPRFGPYLTEGAANTWGDSVNLGEHEVREHILDNALMWMDELGADGLRLDAVHALVDPTPRHLLAELSERTEALATRAGRPLSLIAESDLNDPVMILPRDRGGYGLTAQWSDDYHHAVHVALTGETTGYYEDFASLDALAKAAGSGFVHDGTWSSFRERVHGAPIPDDVEAWRLVTFSQDHDQIGNRAEGDRLTATLSDDRLAVGALLTVLSPFTPMLFMGEEWAARTPWQFFTSHPDHELGEATARGRIAEFTKMGWDPDRVPDPQDRDTFERSRLDWAERDRPANRRILDLYRELIALRRREPAFAAATIGELTATAQDAAGRIELRVGDLRVLANLGTEVWDAGPGDLLAATSAGVVSDLARTVLPPESGAVVRFAQP